MAAKAPSPDNEIWKDIPGFEGVYQASNLGRIRSLPRKKRHKSPYGRWYEQNLKGRVLRQRHNEKGYKLVQLSRVEAGLKPKPYRVHRLICLTFHGPPEGDRNEAAHNDGIRDNNRSDNLRWATRAENMADVAKHNKLRFRVTGGYHRKQEAENDQHADDQACLCRQDRRRGEPAGQQLQGPSPQDCRVQRQHAGR